LAPPSLAKAKLAQLRYCFCGVQPFGHTLVQLRICLLPNIPAMISDPDRFAPQHIPAC
jgi:hypothetical protein